MSSAPARGTECVLLVDDDEQVRKALHLLLKNLGYEAHVASSGNEALEMMDELGDSIELVISDIVMPGIDGVQLASRIRESSPNLPILLISGYSDRVVTEVPGTRFLRKPFSMADLAAEIRMTLETSAAS